MILYKYAPIASGERILQDSTIGFSQPEHFNDPFDMPSYPDEPTADPVSGIFAQLRTMTKNRLWAERTGILSLTRTPANALMWAHYADKHRGVVIGIDAEVAGFTDEESNFIPAQYGSVVYVSRRETGPFVGKPREGIIVGATHHFPQDHYEKLQRVFLHKPLSWSYEEEVRVVKCLHGIEGDQAQTPSGQFQVDRSHGRDLYLYNLPPGSIREVYLGIRADPEQADALVAQAKELHPLLTAFECVLDTENLTVGHREYVSLTEIAAS